MFCKIIETLFHTSFIFHNIDCRVKVHPKGKKRIKTKTKKLVIVKNYKFKIYTVKQKCRQTIET